MRRISLVSPAKINLFLEVTGRLANGYHTLNTIFAKISLADTITVERAGKPGPVKLRLINKSGCALSAAPDNLAVRAAEEFRREFSIQEGLKITLFKKIPVGAGLGGGSSNAATTLLALCRLYKPSLAPAKDKRIMAIAKKLGADVPFFLHKECFCQGKGIGERLTPLKVASALPCIVVAYPGIPVSTAQVYKKLKLGTRADILTRNTNLNKLKVKLSSGVPLCGWRHLLFNRLEKVVLPLHAPVRELHQAMRDWGAESVMMSGSGSCVFALMDDKTAASKLAQSVKQEAGTAYIVRFHGGLDNADNGHSNTADERKQAESVRQRHVRQLLCGKEYEGSAGE